MGCIHRFFQIIRILTLIVFPMQVTCTDFLPLALIYKSCFEMTSCMERSVSADKKKKKLRAYFSSIRSYIWPKHCSSNDIYVFLYYYLVEGQSLSSS